MSRLKLDMHVNDALFAMSEGNPGAIRVLMEGMEAAQTVDPENIMGVWAFLLNLDEYGIYSNRIWRLYKDLCGEDIVKTIALVRSTQMGVLSNETLDKAIDGTETIDIPGTIARLKEVLPSFQI
jgi:hypothetical protein